MIGRIVGGELLPQVRFLSSNLGKLKSTSQKPSSESLAKLKHLFEHFEFKRNLRFHVNHIRLTDPGKHPAPGVLRYSDFVFENQLIFSQYHNFKTNRLKLVHCPTVESVDFRDVLSTFYGLRKPSIDPRYGFCQFALQYPNIRKVALNCSSLTEPVATAQMLTDFLKECRGLTELDLRWTGFTNNDFYRHLPLIFSLRTLETLCLHEDPEVFAARNKQIDFDSYFASFLYLRRLHTTVMPKAKALGYLDKMRIGSEFTFVYLHVSLKDVLCRNKVSRFDRRVNNVEYEVYFEQQTFAESPRMENLKLTDTLDEAKGFLQKNLEKAR